MDTKQFMKKAVCLLLPHPTKPLFLAIARKDDPSKFGMVGGKVDEGESPLEAMLREAHEEAGLDLSGIEIIELKSYVCPGEVDYFTTCFYSPDASWITAMMDQIKQQKDEGELAWVSEEVLIAGPFGEYNKKTLGEWKNLQVCPCCS